MAAQSQGACHLLAVAQATHPLFGAVSVPRDSDRRDVVARLVRSSRAASEPTQRSHSPAPLLGPRGGDRVLADVLATSEEEGRADDFYGRLAEATTSLTSLERVVIFRYDSARRRVRVAGTYGLDVDVFADSFITAESAPIARQALEHDQVIEVSKDLDRQLPLRLGAGQ